MAEEEKTIKVDCEGEWWTYNGVSYGPGIEEVSEEVANAIEDAKKRIREKAEGPKIPYSSTEDVIQSDQKMNGIDEGDKGTKNSGTKSMKTK